MANSQEEKAKQSQRVFFLETKGAAKLGADHLKKLEVEIKKRFNGIISTTFDNTVTDYVVNKSTLEFDDSHSGLKIWGYIELLKELKLRLLLRSGKTDTNVNTEQLKSEIDPNKKLMGYFLVNPPESVKEPITAYFYPGTPRDGDSTQQYNHPFIDYDTNPTESPFETYFQYHETMRQLKYEQQTFSPRRSSIGDITKSTTTTSTRGTASNPSKATSVSSGVSSSMQYCSTCTMFYEGSLAEHRKDKRHALLRCDLKTYQPLTTLLSSIRAWARDEDCATIEEEKYLLPEVESVKPPPRKKIKLSKKKASATKPIVQEIAPDMMEFMSQYFGNMEESLQSYETINSQDEDVAPVSVVNIKIEDIDS